MEESENDDDGLGVKLFALSVSRTPWSRLQSGLQAQPTLRRRRFFPLNFPS